MKTKTESTNAYAGRRATDIKLNIIDRSNRIICFVGSFDCSMNRLMRKVSLEIDTKQSTLLQYIRDMIQSMKCESLHRLLHRLTALQKLSWPETVQKLIFIAALLLAVNFVFEPVLLSLTFFFCLDFVLISSPSLSRAQAHTQNSHSACVRFYVFSALVHVSFVKRLNEQLEKLISGHAFFSLLSLSLSLSLIRSFCYSTQNV